MVVKTLKGNRAKSMVPLPPMGKPVVRVPTEIPSLDGQEVVNDFGVSDAESSDGDDDLGHEGGCASGGRGRQ